MRVKGSKDRADRTARDLPDPGTSRVHVNEVGLRVIPDTATAQAARGIAQIREADTSDSDIDGAPFHVQRMGCNTSGCADQSRIGLRRPVSGNDFEGT